MARVRGSFLFSIIAGVRALQFPSGLVDLAGQQGRADQGLKFETIEDFNEAKVDYGMESKSPTDLSEQPFRDLQLPRTEMVYTDVKHQAVELQSAIEIQENMSMEELRSRKAMFANRLTAQQLSIQGDELINNITQEKLKTVRDETQELRREAGELMTENAALTSQLEAMRKNISTALEFVNASVQEASQRVVANPNLQVLDELRRKDKQRTHSRELKEFARFASMSMLTTGNATDKVAKTPEEFVSILHNSLEAAIAERNSTRAKLDKTFEKLYAQGEEKQASVLRQQAELNQSLANASVIKDRLEQAVSHLEQAKQVLFGKIEALRLFGRARWGAAALPSSASAAKDVHQSARLPEIVSAEQEIPQLSRKSASDDILQSVGEEEAELDIPDGADEALESSLDSANIPTSGLEDTSVFDAQGPNQIAEPQADVELAVSGLVDTEVDTP